MSEEEKFERRTFLKNLFSVIFRRIISSVISFFSIILIARNFGVKANGEYAISLLVSSMFVTFFNLGLSPANVYFIASKKLSIKKVGHINIYLWVLSSALGILLGYFLINDYASIFFPKINPQILYISLLAFPFLLMTSLVISLFQALEEYRIMNFLELMQPIIFLLVIVLLLLFSKTEILFLVIIYTSLSVLFSFASIYLFIQNAEISGPLANIKDFIALIVYGLKSHLSNILSFLNYKADLFLVNLFLSPFLVGIYIVSVQLSEKLWLLSTSLSIVLFPKLSMENSISKTKLTAKSSRLTFSFTLIAALFTVFVSYPLIPICFGIDYAMAYIPLLILLPGIIAGASSRVLANDIAARFKPELNMYIAVFVVLTNLLGNIIMIPRFGLNGAAAATSIAYITNFILKVMAFKKISGSKVLDLIFLKRKDLNL